MFKVIFLSFFCFSHGIEFLDITTPEKKFDLKVNQEVSLSSSNGVNFYSFDGTLLRSLLLNFSTFNKFNFFNNNIYFNDVDGNFCCVDLDCNFVFKIPVSSYFVSDLCFSDGYIFSVSSAGEVFCFDSHTGELMFVSDDLVASYNKSTDSKIIVKDYVYILFHETVFVLNKFTGKVIFKKQFDGVFDFNVTESEVKVYTINDNYTCSLDLRNCEKNKEESIEVDVRDYTLRIKKKEIPKENYRYFSDKTFAFYKNWLVIIDKNDKEYINTGFEIKELWYYEGKLVVFDGKIIKSARI